MSKLADCRVIQLPRIAYREGNITPVHGNREIPFEIKRVFYLYDIPGGESRGAHAHHTCHQFFVAISGSFEVIVDDGREQKAFGLNRPYFGLHVPPGIWAEEVNFSSGGICLVLTSHLYDPEDYIMEYDDFLKVKLLR